MGKCETTALRMVGSTTVFDVTPPVPADALPNAQSNLCPADNIQTTVQNPCPANALSSSFNCPSTDETDGNVSPTLYPV